MLSALGFPMFTSRKKIGSPKGSSKSKSNTLQLGITVGVLFLILCGGVYFVTLQSILAPPSTNTAGLRSATFQASKQEPIAMDTHETLVLSTSKHGNLRIVLRPDLSPESVDYIREIVESGTCQPCNLYRAEKPGILQGILKSPSVPLPTVKGRCPPGSESVPNHCPAWDKECGCHGPIMTRGMVGFAAGQTGPDFFIDGYLRPAKWWGTQHTVWGEIQDVTSFHVLQTIFDLPVKKQGDLTYLIEPLHIDLRIEKERGLPGSESRF